MERTVATTPADRSHARWWWALCPDGEIADTTPRPNRQALQNWLHLGHTCPYDVRQHRVIATDGLDIAIDAVGIFVQYSDEERREARHRQEMLDRLGVELDSPLRGGDYRLPPELKA